MAKNKNSDLKIFSISKKLLLVIIPLFIAAFSVTAVLIFTSSSRTIMNNSKTALKDEADSNAKNLVINLLFNTTSTNLHQAYLNILIRPDSLQSLYDSVSELTVMDDGFSFLANIETGAILAHPDSSIVGTSIYDYDQDTLIGGIAAEIAAGNTELFTPQDGLTKYYAVISFIDDTPWVLVSCISETYVLSDLTNLFFTVIAIFVIILVIVILLVSLSLRRTIKPITSLTEMLVTITDGDFTVSMPDKGNDEIALMSRSLNDFVEIMRDVISDIRDISNQLNNSSDGTKQVAETLNQAAASQADSMSDVKVTLDQVASGVQELALHATTLSGVVNDTNRHGGMAKENMRLTVEVASQGRRDMEEVSSAMDSIVSSMSHLEEIVDKVGASTEQINTMVGIISDISDQTNLLSLNASIEAARAGEAGRGFAVVAEEIGKLAEVSASSAAQISDIITQVNSQVSYMVQQTSQSVTYIRDNSGKISAAQEIFEKIYKNVSETDQILSDIVSQISNVDDAATNIAALSQEQSASTEEILASTEVLAQASLQFSTDSQHVSESADQVSDASFALAEHMRKFKI